MTHEFLGMTPEVWGFVVLGFIIIGQAAGWATAAVRRACRHESWQNCPNCWRRA